MSGAVEAVATLVHAPPPVRTCRVASVAPLIPASTVTVPVRAEARLASDSVGGVESTVTRTAAVNATLPAPSVIFARTS